MTQTAPKSMRLHIGIFGRRNVGKSSLLNAITRQQVSIVSATAGTTTDPVEKPMELLPLGPVLFIDTAGIDDTGALGAQRVARTRQAIERTDLALLVTESGPGAWTEFEDELLAELQAASVPVIAVFNKADLAGVEGVGQTAPAPLARLAAFKIPAVATSTTTGAGLLDLRQTILDTVPQDYLDQAPILADLVGPGELAVLVVPIDKEAPKGRLILPQVQAIRDLLDGDAMCMVVKESDLARALGTLATPPRLVVTDSQAFRQVAAATPPGIPLTSFSILFSRYRGDLVTQALGAAAVDSLCGGDRILVAEACTHHPIGDDIGRIKIPNWLNQYVGAPLEFEHVQGRDFPEDLSPYKLVIHCGACMFNRRLMLNRILKCRAAGVPITNYGLIIAYSLGLFSRALEPFPAAREALNQHQNDQRNEK